MLTPSNIPWLVLIVLALGSLGLLAVRVKVMIERHAKSRSTPQETAPTRREDMGALASQIRNLTSKRFRVTPDQLTDSARLNEDLRIPRSELFDFIDDLEERFPLQGPPGDTSKIVTFGDLAARFIPAVPNDR